MKKFRIKVDLSAFFNDERKLAHILVDPAWESVKNLQQRVEQIFEVINVRFITNEGCFIPPQEPIQVIKNGDVLRAFIPAGDMNKKRKKEKPNNEVPVKDDEKVKKRKRELVSKDTVFTSSTPNHAKRSKSIQPPDVAIKNSTVDEITSTSEQLGLKFEKQKQINTKIVTNAEEMETSAINDASCQKTSDALTSENNNEVTKKRRRKKKNKNQSPTKSSETLEESEMSVLGTEDTALVKPSTSVKLRSCSSTPASARRNKSAPKLGHSYFSDTGETVSTTTENGVVDIPAKVIFRCPVSDVSYDKPRIFSLKKTNPGTSETENIQGAPETEESLLDDVPEPARIRSKSPVIIEELVIIPNLAATVQNNKNDKSSNVNETVDNQTDQSMTNTTEQGEQETTTAADDSSVIAIESECDEDSEEEEDEENEKENKDETNEQNEDVSEIIDLNASDDDDNESQQSTIIISAGNPTAETPEQNMSIAEMLPFSILLETLPLPDEIIIFKLTRLDGKMSGFIAGKCEYINKRTKIIKLHVIDGKKEISGIPNKYICSLDDSTATDKQYLQIKYNDLLEAKLFSVN